MKTFKSTRNQFVDGEFVGKDKTIEVEEDRVKYLIHRGYLVEAEAPKKTAKSKAAK